MASSIIADQRRALKASKLVEQLHIAGATSATVPYIDDGAEVPAVAR